MTGLEYENLVAKYLRRHGYHNVSVTKGSGDYGVDVIAHQGKHKYAVQCKYYSSAVSLDAVQEAVAGMAMYGCDRAMVVTNNTFTQAAVELATNNGVTLIEGVTSTGINPVIVAISALAVPVLFTVAALAGMFAAVGETIINQLQSRQYAMALYNIFSILAVSLVIGGIVYLICRKRKSPPKNGERKGG